MWPLNANEKNFLRAAGLLSGLCLTLFVFRRLLAGHYYFVFIPGNLLLAWLALIFAWLLTKQLKIQAWSSWQNIALTFIWLVFLPNTWYVLTDFIHVVATQEVSLLFDITLIFSLVISGFFLGFSSLYLVHRELIARLGRHLSHVAVTLIILLASFAIYLGRDLRWNTWDVITNPAGLIINVSDRVLNPFGYPRALNVTVLFFLLLSSTYFAFWFATRPLRLVKKAK